MANLPHLFSLGGKRMVVAESLTSKKVSPSILLAEDSDDDAFFFQRALSKTCPDCHFQRARNGKVAIQLLEATLNSNAEQNGPPVVLFLDLKMPLMNGFEVLECVQSRQLHKNLRIIVLSGSNDYSDRERAARLGASEYLVKPISRDDLAERLRSLSSLPESDRTETWRAR
jgi:CheY-like chemotaxis protein